MSRQGVPEPKPRTRSAGLTLVEVAVFVCLVGILLAVSLPTFFRALRTSKMAEAPYELSRIYAGVAAYYAATHEQHLPPPPPPPKSGSGARNLPPPPAPARVVLERCMPDAAGPAPAEPSLEPVEVDFHAATTPGAATWSAIDYQPSGAIRYRYTLSPSAPGCGNLPADSRGEAVLTLRAEGDLDGDGVLSLFERNVAMHEHELSLDPFLFVRDRVE